MKKFLIFFSLFFFISQIGFSQSFMNSFGVTLSFLQAKNPSTNSYKTQSIQKLGTYFPKYNLSEKDNSSFSIGVPLSAGIGNVNGGGDGVFFSFDVPLMFDYNMGCNSTPDNESGFGGYVGLGFGYNYTGISSGYGDENMNSYGPIVHAGISFLISKDSRPLTFGAFYKLGMEEGKFKTFGINILY